jgi:hypothetical protein
MNRMFRLLIACAVILQAQPPKPIQAQESSTFNYTSAADGSQTVQIRNVSYEVTGTNIPGRPPDDRLLLRKTIRSKQVLGDIGMESTVAIEAWRLGVDLRQRSLYTLNASGAEANIKDDALIVVSRGLEEVEWCSVYKLGSGQHLFDTYVPLESFSISRETTSTRYVGLDVPPDDTKDARLREPNVIAVLSYASGSRLIREALLTSDDRQQARLLRSYADVTRTLSVREATVHLTFTQNYPSPPNPVDVAIQVKSDDLDLANAKLPAKVHVSAWKR